MTPRPPKLPPILFWPALVVGSGAGGTLLASGRVGLYPFLALAGLTATAALVAALARGSRRPAFLLAPALVLLPPAYTGVQKVLTKLAERRDRAAIVALVTDEERILALTPQLGKLSGSLLNLRLPDPAAAALFAGGSVEVTDLDTAATSPNPARAPGMETGPDRQATGVPLIGLPVPQDTAPAPVRSASLDLWRPLLDRVDYFEHAAFAFVDGRFPVGSSGRGPFDTQLALEGLARMRNGDYWAVRGKVDVRWERSPGGGGAGRGEDETSGEEPAEAWLITRWVTRSLEANAAPRPFFEESLDRALPDPAARARARTSLHQRATVRFFEGGAKLPPSPLFAPISANQKPGLAVADVDGDGWDDLYVTVRIGRNLLLRNRGDGTFEEAAAALGLDLPGNSTAALFADFDNDGDPDAFIGRSIQPSVYLENEGGRFTPREVGAPLPALAIALAAADVDGDGLLDIYVCTYRPATLDGTGSPAGGVAAGAQRWPDNFLPPEEAKEFYRRHAAYKSGGGLFGDLLDQPGPPNVLLLNRGGGQFIRAGWGEPIAAWRNTLQGTWCDYDRDGDPDIYLANDWAPDALLQNDGAGGFTAVEAAAGTTGYGFAMGVTWGDYDNDGRQDLYVSNMYSKAGRRITSRIPGLDPRFVESAAGNFLYRQVDAGRFERVAGSPTASAGWSWGGQFADLDNDGFLDLHVLSGYFTAPPSVASELDL